MFKLFNVIILQELLKHDRSMRQANAVRKMAPIDLLNAGMPQTFNLYKMRCLQSAVKQCTIKPGVPVCPELPGHSVQKCRTLPISGLWSQGCALGWSSEPSCCPSGLPLGLLTFFRLRSWVSLLDSQEASWCLDPRLGCPEPSC